MPLAGWARRPPPWKAGMFAPSRASLGTNPAGRGAFHPRLVAEGRKPLSKGMALNSSIKSAFRRLINSLGYDIVGFLGGSPRGRMADLLERHQIDVILDVGAFEGAFGR